VDFFMIDFTWKVFSQTGNIETYLLLKELESDEEDSSKQNKNNDKMEIDTNF
jgi:YqzL-like protein